jgi:hypothetical protein
MSNSDYILQLNTIGNNVTGVTLEDSLFKLHAPKPKGVKAVKLSKDNLDAVAKRLRQVLSSQHDDVSVTVTEDRISATYDVGRGLNFYIGDWIAEGFDYTRNKVIFDRATQKTREKHDLR